MKSLKYLKIEWVAYIPADCEDNEIYQVLRNNPVAILIKDKVLIDISAVDADEFASNNTLYEPHDYPYTRYGMADLTIEDCLKRDAKNERD